MSFRHDRGHGSAVTRTSNRKNNGNRSNNRNGKNNRKGKSLAIVHVAMKSSSTAPPAAAHADYILRDGRYARRGGVGLFKSGNMPEFAEADPRAFWVAADTHERANGRTYTELQIALPRELGKAQREALAMEATREFLGDRFAYTMAIHNPVAKDKIDQPHLHLMFSERVIDETTRSLSEERFFKQNGAKKDREWNSRSKPEEIRTKWCELMNAAMAREGIDVTVDPRSWADQGREDLAELREPKELGGDKDDAKERRQEIAELRECRKELPAMSLDGAAALQQIEAEAAAQIVAIEMKLEEELGLIDRLIAKAKETIEKFSQRVQGVFGGGPSPVVARVAPPSREERAAAEKAKSILSRIDRLATREQGAAWIDNQVAAREQEMAFAIRRSAQYQSGRSLFESETSLDDVGFRVANGAQLAKLGGSFQHWRGKAASAEKQIAEHPQTKSWFQRAIYEPDPLLKVWQAEADRARGIARDEEKKYARIEAQWTGHEDEWNVDAEARRTANDKQIEKLRQEIDYLKDGREPALRELARRDGDPQIQAERETLRQQKQKQKEQQRQKGRGDFGMGR
jgi:hypothetical protein